GATTNSITYTPTTASVTLKVTISNASGCAIINTKNVTTQCGGPVPPAPAGVVATASSATSVTVAWNVVPGATSYDIYRSSSVNSYVKIGSSNTTGYNDTTVTTNGAYLYRVRAWNGAGQSADSNIDLATTVIFTDPTLSAGSTRIKAMHINELRTAVGAV